MAESRGRFVWYELTTTNVETAKTFYAHVVGWGAQRISASGMDYSLFTAGESPVAGLLRLPEEAARRGATPHWIGYVEVDDVDAAVEKTRRFGGIIHVPPTNLPGVSRFAIVTDPQLATFAMVKGLKPRQEPPPGLGAPGRVGWHELLAADWEKAFDYYSALFGWRKADGHVGLLGAYQGFAVGSTTMGGMFTKPPTLPHPFWLYYFNVADVAGAANRVEAHGGQVLYGPVEAPGGAWIAHCADPQGAVFGLLERRGLKAVGYSVKRGPSGAARAK
jgi:predicted enzyme related to lactoylglutathione lyase